MRGINSAFAWRIYLWLVHREALWNYRHGYATFIREVETKDENGIELLYEETVDPPPCLWTRLKHLMFWLGFIPF